MPKQNFKIEGEYIELIQLLKAIGLAQTGGHAKIIVNDGLVFRNGENEFRKRAKLIPGDVIKILEDEIVLE
jgi:ribosome-associated protein